MQSHAGAVRSNWIIRFQLFGLLRIAGKTMQIHKLNAHIFDAVVSKVQSRCSAEFLTSCRAHAPKELRW
jgi:hypothetical protein